MVLVAALVTLAAAASAAAGADAVAATATINADRSPETLLGDDAPFFGSTPELGDRRTLAKKRGCNPKKNTSCCRDRKSKCVKQVFGDPLKPWKSGKPTKCAKRGFQGKCRASCDAYWSDIEFCYGPAYVGSKEELLAKMGARPKKPRPGSVDWTTGVPCVCTQYTDGATAKDAAKTGLCQKKLPEHDGLGGEAIPCRSLHVHDGSSIRCTGDYEFCTAHPPSPPPSPPPPPPPSASPSPPPPPPPCSPGNACPTSCVPEKYTDPKALRLKIIESGIKDLCCADTSEMTSFKTEYESHPDYGVIFGFGPFHKLEEPKLYPGWSTDPTFTDLADLKLCWDTSKVTDLKYFAKDSENFNAYLNHWDTSSVTTLFGAFEGGTEKEPNFHNVVVADWDVSKVTKFDYLFDESPNFNGDVGGWDVSKGEGFGSMFARSPNFNHDLSGWDVSSATRLSYMFNGAAGFNGDISNWDTAKVTSFKRMLLGAMKFDGDLSKWDVSSYPAGLPLYTGSTQLNPPEPDFYG